MDFCNTVDLLYDALPLRPFRDWLIRAHIERCPRCQARLLSCAEARSLLVRPDQIRGTDDLWRRIAAQAGQARPVRGTPARGAIVWRWAAVTAMVAAVTLAGFWFLRQVESPGLDGVTIASAARFELGYLKVGGAPAQAFIYQPHGTDTVFIWASKTP